MRSMEYKVPSGSLDQDVKEIHNKFPSISKNTIAPVLLKYTYLEHGERLRNTLRDLIEYNDTCYTPEELISDITYISKMFPNASKMDIEQQLRSLGKIISRTEIVVKDLLAGPNAKILKRKSTDVHFDELSISSGPSLPKKRLLNDSDEKNGIVTNGVIKVLCPKECTASGFDQPSTSRIDMKPGFKCGAPKPQLEVAEVINEIVDTEDIEQMDLTTDDSPIDTRLLYHIMEMFPEADPKFLRQQVKSKEFNEANIGLVVDLIFNTPNYPKRSAPSPEPEDGTINPELKVETLREILPDADPTYLMNSLQNISTEKEFTSFVSTCLEMRNYPTYKEYLRKQQLSSQVKQYTTDFSVEKFVELFPDPEAFFNSPKCKAMVIRGKCDTYHFVYNYLRNRYPMICIKTIQSIFGKANTIAQACEMLEATKTGMLRYKRKQHYSLEGLTDIPLYQVFAYIEYKEDIMNYLNNKKEQDRVLREAAKKNGLMKTCGCCYEEEVMPFEVVTCEEGCEFCKNCVEQSVKILFYEEKLEFPCLMDCGSKFNIQTLQKTLKPKMFSKLVQKKQLQEIKAAGIEDVEFCPFCDFATIVTPENKLFVCLNPDCMKESCRLCKETSHIPLRCDEIEKDEDVKNRVYIENKMTEALLRKCYKCELTFIKADGCNKMTCSCGAMMCYVCNKPVQDYKHFNGQGGDKLHLCPLYSDTIALHRDQVLKSAVMAKQTLGEKVKIDPTVGLEEYYKDQMKKNPSKVPPGMR